MRIYRSLIVSIALHGRETWTLRSIEENKLLVFEMDDPKQHGQPQHWQDTT